MELRNALGVVKPSGVDWVSSVALSSRALLLFDIGAVEGGSDLPNAHPTAAAPTVPAAQSCSQQKCKHQLP